jgi:hypothetical protein
VRLLLRDEAHEFPKEALDLLSPAPVPAALAAAAARMKASIDPEGVLNPEAGGDA